MFRSYTLKAILICLAIIININFIEAQNQRLVILEHFTQASCPPCATVDPILEALLNQNTAKVASIKYHMSWPGIDPMYSHNPTDANTRTNYYGISGIPQTHLDGNVFANHPGNLNQAIIDSRYGTTSPLNISLTTSINNGVVHVNVAVSTNATLLPFIS